MKTYERLKVELIFILDDDIVRTSPSNPTCNEEDFRDENVDMGGWT